MTNKEILQQALRHLHWAQGYFKQLAHVHASTYLDAWEALQEAEEYIIELRENER